jgi:aspartate-semialdehyde dehydrogenase
VLSSSEDDEASATILGSLEAEIESVDTLFLAGPPANSKRALEIWQESERKPLIIDLTGALEGEPAARLGIPGQTCSRSEICVVPHPAALIVWKLITAVKARYEIQQCVIHVIEPASERGNEGIKELQQQTAGLLNFRALDKRVFDAQLAFAVLPRYGTEAPTKLEDVEHRIDRHLATLFGKPPLPSLRLIQAPVFHGYSLSFWMNLGVHPEIDHVSYELSRAGIDVYPPTLEPPTNVGATGQAGISVGVLEVDRNNANACWIWAVADNLRLVVEHALLFAGEHPDPDDDFEEAA